MSHSPEFDALCEDARSRITEITLEQWISERAAWTLVDVREDREWVAEHIPGAVHCGRGVLERDALKHWPKDTPLVLYCGGGFRSALAADNLQKMGFTRVRSLEGGIKKWRRDRSIDFYFDVVCPYAYMGALKVVEIAQRTASRVVWKPILLGGVFKQIEAPVVPAEHWSKNRAARIAEDLLRAGERLGIELHAHPDHPRRSVYAMRILLSAPEERWPELAFHLWRAYWEQGQDLNDDRFLKRFIVSQSVQPQPEAKAELIVRTEEAVARGVFGVPSVFVGDHFFYGQDRMHLLEKALGGDVDASFERSDSGGVIEFFHDFSSPFSYLASTRVEELAAAHGATVLYRPMLLGGLFRSIGTPDVPLNAMSEPKRRYMLKDLHDQADWVGAPLRWPGAFPLRTILPLRISIVEQRTISVFYEAAWARGQDLGEPEVVHRVLTEAGFDADALLAAAQDPEVKATLRDNTDRAGAIGVCGAPTFHVKGHLVWGNDRMDHVEALLQGWVPPQPTG